MKKLKVKKDSTCMACLACVGACSEAFYKVFDPDKACLQIVEKKAVRPIACPQCGKCAEACPEGAITQNPKGVYMINKGVEYNLAKVGVAGSSPVFRSFFLETTSSCFQKK